MNDSPARTYTAFQRHQRLAAGPLGEVALKVKHVSEQEAIDPVLIFDDSTGRSVDVDIRGSDDEVLARYTEVSKPRGRGRPKLGVVAREVTLLPRHWEWLAAQPGSASVTLRKLVEQARLANDGKDSRRAAQERAYHFMSAMAGDMPGFEEASRALFADDLARMRVLIATWPEDVRNHALALVSTNSPDKHT